MKQPVKSIKAFAIIDGRNGEYCTGIEYCIYSSMDGQLCDWYVQLWQRVTETASHSHHQGAIQAMTLNEYTKQEWFDIARELKPNLTADEYEAMWCKFCELKVRKDVQ